MLGCKSSRIEEFSFGKRSTGMSRSLQVWNFQAVGLRICECVIKLMSDCKRNRQRYMIQFRCLRKEPRISKGGVPQFRHTCAYAISLNRHIEKIIPAVCKIQLPIQEDPNWSELYLQTDETIKWRSKQFSRLTSEQAIETPTDPRMTACSFTPALPFIKHGCSTNRKSALWIYGLGIFTEKWVRNTPQCKHSRGWANSLVGSSVNIVLDIPLG